MEEKHKLIIEGNAFYEIDLECLKKKEQEKKEQERKEYPEEHKTKRTGKRARE